ncbi:MAG: hypothetical protein HY722_02200 [Planctomycetes bacterium]|nr:hypothetical protein [Planctomycetota bacterium]
METHDGWERRLESLLAEAPPPPVGLALRAARRAWAARRASSGARDFMERRALAACVLLGLGFATAWASLSGTAEALTSWRLELGGLAREGADLAGGGALELDPRVAVEVFTRDFWGEAWTDWEDG